MSNLDHKEIQIRVITAGADAVRGLILNSKISPYSAKRALRELKRREDVDTEAVKAFEAMLYDVGFIGRNTKPQEGEIRRYKVQDSQRDTRYIRLPVDFLGLKPGDQVEAEFFVGEAIVRPVD